MQYIKKDTKRYLLLGAILVLIGYTGYFYAVILHAEHIILKERIASVRNNLAHGVSLVDYLVKKHNDWDNGFYTEMLKPLVEILDAQPNVYVELLDDSLTTISERIVPETDLWAFDLRSHSDFMEQLLTENSGETVIICTNLKDNEPLDVYFYWRWIPTDKEYENRVLMLIGVTKYSVNTQLDCWVAYGIIALILTSAFFILGSIMMLTVERRQKAVPVVSTRRSNSEILRMSQGNTESKP